MNYLKILFLLLISKTYSQTFKEAIDFHDNGKVKTEYVKNIDLKLIKVNIYDINEKLLEFTNYDPETGNKDGSFMEGTNEGFYDQNKLNCKFCSILVSNYRYSNIKFEGEFKNGYPIGQVDVYQLFENKIERDEYVRFLKSLDKGRQMNYSSLVGLNLWEKRFLYTLNFNPDGLLDGNIKISKTSELSFQNGLLTKILSTNPKNESIYKDSLGRDFKVWKIDNKYYRNTGFLSEFNWNDYEGDRSFSVSSIEVNKDEDFYDRRWFFFGSEKTKYINGNPLVVFDGYNYSPILNESGVFQRKINGKHYDSSYSNEKVYNSLEDLVFSIPLDLDNYSILINDIGLREIINNIILSEKKYWDFDEKDPLSNEDEGIVLILNEFKRSLNEGVELTPQKYYKFIQKILDDPGSPFVEVYVVDPQLAFNSLYMSEKYNDMSYFRKYKNEEDRNSSIFYNNSSLIEKEVFYETYKKYHTKKLQEYEEMKRSDVLDNSKKPNLQLDKYNDSNSSSNQPIIEDNSSKFEDKYFELTGTSLKKENKKKYSWVLKSTAKRISGCIKIHLLTYNNGKEIDTNYFKYFFENEEYLTQFKKYVNSEGLFETVFQNGSTLYIRRKN